jgi:hypothetical protein
MTSPLSLDLALFYTTKRFLCNMGPKFKNAAAERRKTATAKKRKAWRRSHEGLLRLLAIKHPSLLITTIF